MICYTLKKKKNHVMRFKEGPGFVSALVSKANADAKSNTLETFLRNLKLNQPGVTSTRWSWIVRAAH